MRCLLCLAVGSTLLVQSSGDAFAYELTTHAAMSASAFRHSQATLDANVLRDLGLDTQDPNPLGGSYFFFNGNTAPFREPHLFENKRIGDLREDAKSIVGWLMRGAIREDDLSPSGCSINGFVSRIEGRRPECNPKERDGGNIDRPLNHFFDPVSNQGLHGGIAQGSRAVHWSLGAADTADQPTTPSPGRTNRFSLADARQAMYYALSGRVPSPQIADEATRKAWWATAFYSLGSVLHTVQDMAQPQHTRNDTHPGSVFERYIDARAAGETSYRFDGFTVESLAPLDLAPRETIASPRAFSDFWSTRWTDTEVEKRRGLADYANRNFLTDGTNLGDIANGYASPSRNRCERRIA